MILLTEDPKLDQDKLIEKIKEKKMVGLSEGIIRVGVKAYLTANQKKNTENKPVSNELQPITIT